MRRPAAVALLIERARALAPAEGVPRLDALASVYETTRSRVERALAALGRPFALLRVGESPLFLCDGSLGGLARWLRAAGHEAAVTRAKGDRLLAEAAGRGLVLLTTDARLWERRAVREQRVAALWVPSGMPHHRQLAVVRRDLALPLRAPRCMECGGMLRTVAKAAVAERIPPRTARWKDEYFLCTACGRLLWRGTHWERIAARLGR